MTTALPVLERDALLSSDSDRPKRNSPSFILPPSVYIKSPQPECYSINNSPLSSSQSSTGQSSPAFSSIYRTSPPPITLPPTPEEPEDDDIIFPSYDAAYCSQEKARPLSEPPSLSSNPPAIEQSECEPIMPRIIGDDTSIEDEPTNHVDYLSHDWKEEDIWSSWKYIASRREEYNNGMRLENAVWRTWAKAKFQLGTVTPESLNWLKDCDVTWLYGPLQTASKSPASPTSPPPTRISNSNPFLDKKPILKKRTASQAILQRSISTRTLLSHAGAILQAREADSSRGRPVLDRTGSDYSVPRNYFDNATSSSRTTTMSPGTETPSDRRHISFNDEVSQCIAVEGKDDYYDDDMDDSTCVMDDDMLSEDGVLMTGQRPLLSSQSTPRSSFSSDSKTIAPLPPTTLKYRRDTPEPEEEAPAKSSSYSWWPLPVPRLSHSSSTETLRPPKQQQQQYQAQDNFLLDDDDDATVTPEMDVKWQSSQKMPDKYTPPTYNGPWFTDSFKQQRNDSNRGSSYFSSQDQFPSFNYDNVYNDNDAIAHSHDENAEAMDYGFIGKVVDTVNTARDIAHVIWNVGWRS
ncbi:hypothetical protein AJ79_03865 [Helicocarpus griseus UAMH5409]|uniref:Nitrogen regulatory protein areA GATA-like domain-containing protein n=1 Tax=Helicocarpus griseus UAMH5409 TaxID=1447875 RepID=A0A2B7XX62_9EURO|nr:hypothetical protein AJ79_03865 [Helicocarpus griseus UAMH5409]